MVLGVASEGATSQWDGHRTPTGVLLRWFHPDAAGFPDLGYDVFRATLPDSPGLPIYDGSRLQGQPEWNHIGEVVVRDAAGLSFNGTPALLAVPGSVLTLDFPDPAWSVVVRTDPAAGDIEVSVWAGGAVRETVRLRPGDTHHWISRGIDRLAVTGDGGFVSVHYALLHSQRFWTHLVHRCLPVHDPAYPCAPPAGVRTEEEDAVARLPQDVQAEWGKRFAPRWAQLSAVLRRIALRQPPLPLPPHGPDGPAVAADEATLLRLAILDPHLARIVGLAYDDANPGGRGALVSYRVTGRWLGDVVAIDVGRGTNARTFAEHGLTVTVDPPSRSRSVTSLALGRGGGTVTFEWQGEVVSLAVDVNVSARLAWVAYDAAGSQVGDGQVARAGRIDVAGPVHRVEVSGSGTLRLVSFMWRDIVERYGLLPGIEVGEPGPPPGPAWITADVPQQSTTARLDWDVTRSTGGSVDGGSVFFQVAAADTGGNPDKPAPPAPKFGAATMLRDGALVVVPRGVAAQPSPRTLLMDRDGVPGWRAWWARGVDLFGRVSEPSPPVLARIADDAPPPPPRIVEAEYVQAALDDILGRSVLGQQWLDATPGTDGVVVAFAWTPELDAVCSEVDGFRLVLRKSTTAAWPGPYASIGPLAVRHEGTVQNAAVAGDVLTVETDVAAPAVADTWLMAGLLLVGDRRLLVSDVNGGTFTCQKDGRVAPKRGDKVVWYPVFVVAVADTGFGPKASLTTPVATAQVAVRSVRRSGIESVESLPADITAVDVTVPDPPDLKAIPSGPFCAEVASRADWFGRSYFTLTWTKQPSLSHTVHRALGDGIMRLDRARQQDIPEAAWPPGVDVALVRADLTALKAAKATNDAAQVDAAYAALRADAQRVIAAQEHTWPAYAALHGAPIDVATYTDTLDGRSRAHWFYRVTSRTPAGLVGAPSLPTPPICCPDVVAPAPPAVRTVLAAERAVRLDGVTVPDRDAVTLHVHRWPDESIGSDVRRRKPEHSFAMAGTVDVPAAPGDWCLWVTAEDKAGNVSPPSRMLRGTSLLPPPSPPKWTQAKRDQNGVALAWTHPDDLRLACLVERRPAGGGLWTTVSGWLPRGVYAFTDTPPGLDASWDYRLRVRDALGQPCPDLPTTNLPEA